MDSLNKKNVSINYIHIKGYQFGLIKCHFYWPTPHFSLNNFPNRKNSTGFSPPFWRAKAEVDSSVDSGGVGCHFVLQSQTSGSQKKRLNKRIQTKRGYHRNAHNRGKQKGVRYLGGWIFPRTDGDVVLITMSNK